MTSTRLIFFSAAAVNAAVALAFIIAPQAMFQSMTGQEAPGQDAVFYLFATAVFAFGLGYYWVGLDFAKNRPIAQLAMYGKALVMPVAVIAYLTGALALSGLAGAGIDLVYAVLFAWALRKESQNSAAA